MKYPFHPDAVEEFTQAVEYYESCGAGLGYDFALEAYMSSKHHSISTGLASDRGSDSTMSNKTIP